jgi:hypothetical protein
VGEGKSLALKKKPGLKPKLDERARGGSWRRTWWNVPSSLSLSLLFGGSVHDGFRPKRALPVVTRAIRRSHRNTCSRVFVASWTLVMLSSAIFCNMLGSIIACSERS